MAAISSYTFRRYKRTQSDSRINFQTRIGSLEEMCDLVQAVVHSGSAIWDQTKHVEIELRIVALNPILQVSFCSDTTGEAIVFSTRERALMGRITRAYAARPVGPIPDAPKPETRSWGWTYMGSDWTQNNPYVVLHIEAPSMHEKMEAIELLRHWLRQHWPEGEKHLARVV